MVTETMTEAAELDSDLSVCFNEHDTGIPGKRGWYCVLDYYGLHAYQGPFAERQGAENARQLLILDRNRRKGRKPEIDMRSHPPASYRPPMMFDAAKLPLQLDKGDTLVVHTDYFLDPEVRAVFREAVLRDCNVPGMSMIFLPPGVEVRKASGVNWGRFNPNALTALAEAAITLLQSPYRRPSDDPQCEEEADGEARDWDALRTAIAGAGFSWEEAAPKVAETVTIETVPKEGPLWIHRRSWTCR